MTERDYLLVTALQRLRMAEQLVLEAHPEFILPDVMPARYETLRTIGEWISRLEDEVETERKRSQG